MPLSDYPVANANAIASRVMYELLGRRWIWPAITTTETITLQPMQKWAILAGKPVISVDSVTLRRPGIADTIVAYVLENKHRLRFLDEPQFRPGLCGGGMDLEVTYTYGAPPPKEVEMAIEALSDQLVLAFEGSDECKLPDRVTSVSRQGISMTILDPQDFLTEGRTGIALVDQALRNYNPSRALRPARVYSANNPPPRRRSTTQAEETS